MRNDWTRLMRAGGAIMLAPGNAGELGDLGVPFVRVHVSAPGSAPLNVDELVARRPRIGMFSLFRLPLGAFRPNDLLFVYEDQRRLAGLVRVERRINHMGGHAQRHVIQRPEGGEVHLLQLPAGGVDARQFKMAVAEGAPMSRNMLHDWCHSTRH